MKRLLTGIGLTILLFVPAVASAQILVAGEGPVVYGHHHLNTTNMDAQKKFFVDTLGGSVAKIGTGDRQQEIIKFPNVLIFFRPMQAPTGGSIGTTVNHIGFSVPDLRPLVAKIKANGFKMITADSVAANVKVTDDIAAASPTTNLAFALGPEDVKVEFVEVQNAEGPDSASSRPFLRADEHRDAGVVRKDVRRNDAPGQSGVRFRRGSAARRVPELFAIADADRRHHRPIDRSHRLRDQKSRGVHEEARSRRASSWIVPTPRCPQLGIAIAFIKDPWGTNIEMTEGLADIK